ncbi:MAG: hypothetical protein FJX48_01015 [Alphaproteobacteria bacterium]|nr:hypothetical protein [Alphaproteobacteria bacterium]
MENVIMRMVRGEDPIHDHVRAKVRHGVMRTTAPAQISGHSLFEIDGKNLKSTAREGLQKSRQPLRQFNRRSTSKARRLRIDSSPIYANAEIQKHRTHAHSKKR